MMMLPIAVSVVHLLLDDVKTFEDISNKGERNFATGLLLSIGYASSLGGMATIVGTPPNVVFKGLLEDFFDLKISFAEWMVIGVPVAAILIAANYFLVTKIIFPNNLKKVEGSETLIANRLAKLGPVKRSEKLVLVIFSITAFFWMFQQPINEWLNIKLLNDTTIGMCGGLLMFMVPVDFKQGKFILTWTDTEKLAWGILFLFGGGLCLAEGLDEAGIIGAVGQWIAGQNEFTIWFSLILIVIAVLLSELMSNVALVNVFVPVVFGIASVMNVNPILMGLPVTLGASIALMFPIATPPNAIVFSSGYIRIQDMVKAGALLNIISIIIIWLFSITLVQWMFG
jgi:sodium-dependent dicarboxylate transporter 2/3/5